MSSQDQASLKSLEKTNGILIVIGLLLITLLYLPTLEGMVSVWLGESSHYSHGVLLVFIAAYILYTEWNLKSHLFHVYPRIHTSLLIIFLSIIWFLAQSTQIQVVTQIAFILIMAVFIIGLFGYKQIGSLVFPILLLFTAVPIWTVFSEPLQLPTAIVVDKILHVTGYVSFRDGIFIHIPEGTIEVSDVCSGVNNQIVSITLSLLLAYFYRLGLVGMLLLALLGSLIAFLSNSIRIYIVVLAGHYTQMQHSLIHDHVWLGWVVFSIFFTLFFIISSYFMKKKVSVKNDDKLSTQIISKKGTRLTSIKVAVMLIFAAAMGPVLSMTLQVLNKTDDNEINFELPRRIGEWRITDEGVQGWKPVWVSPDVIKLERYKNEAGRHIDLYLSYYAYQSQGKEIINSENIAYDRNKWRVIETNIAKQIDSSEGIVELQESIIQDEHGSERILWQWYKVGGVRTVDDLEAKYLGLLAALKGRTEAMAFILSTEIDQSNSRTRGRESLQQFASSMNFKSGHDD